MDREDLVSVCTVQSPTEAEIIRGALASAGIACEIGGETQAGFAGVLEIDVLTHASDVERARDHLGQLRRESQLRAERHVEAKKAKAQEAERLKEAIQELPKPVEDIQMPPEQPLA